MPARGPPDPLHPPRVEVVPYDPRWPARFDAEACRLAPVFGASLVAIHHIGSTSVPGLAAKPIIDLLVAVACIESVDAADASMIALGYEGLGEFGIAGRRYYRRSEPDGTRTHHLHAFGAASSEVARHLAFRDYLRAHPAECRLYAALKRSLAARHPRDLEAYMDGKEALVGELEAAARAWRGA